MTNDDMTIRERDLDDSNDDDDSDDSNDER
jgi:hypothetical protein